MSLVQINYQPVNSGLGDTAPAGAAKINAAFVETDTALANANAALAAAGTASTTATAAQTTANGFSTQITTLNTEVATLTTTTNNLAASIVGIAGSKVITASAWPGIDKTGVTSSLTAWNALVAQAVTNYAAGLPTTILIDCPIYLSIASTAANTLFHPANVNMQGTPDGMIITDNLGAPFMFFCNVSNITWKNVHIRYVQPLNGTFMMNQNVASGWVGIAGSFQNQYLGGNSGYLATTQGVVYASGGTPVWNGPSALTGLFNMRGNCHNITFDGCTVDVPQGASPAGFVYTLIQYSPEWVPNTVVIGLQNISSASWNSGTQLVTVTCGANLLSKFTIGNQYSFYISGNAVPAGYKFSSVYVTVTSSNTFTYPVATNPGTYTGPGYFATQINTINTAVPQNIAWKNCLFDGIVMGHVGTGQINFIGNTWNRYSDLQDGTNGVITFQTAPSSGSTTATLAVNWPYPTAQYWVTLGNTQMIGMNMTSGQVGCTGFVDPFSGATTSVIGTMVASGGSPGNGATSMVLIGWALGAVAASQNLQVQFTNPTNDVRTVTVTTPSPYTTFTANFTALTSACTSATQTIIVGTAATSGTVGGVAPSGSAGYLFSPSPFSPPPHAIYMGSSTGSYPYANVQAKANLDLGVRVWNAPTSRSMQNSGNALSLKVELGRGTNVDEWTSFRPDGGSDLQSFNGTVGSSITNLKVYFDSSTPQTDYLNNTPSTLPHGTGIGYPVVGVRLPGPSPYSNITLQNVSLVDANLSPTKFAFYGTTFTPNQNIKAKDIQVYMNDWNPSQSAGTYMPLTYMAGTNIEFELSVFMNSMSTTYTGQGYIPGNQAFNQNSNLYYKFYGWRAVAVTCTFTGGSAGTTATLSNQAIVGGYPSGWPFPTGIYKVFFYDNSVRYVTFTNGAWTMTWTNQAVEGDGVSTYAGNTAQNLYQQNYSNYKPRLIIPTTYGYENTRLRIDDYTNGLFMDCTGNMSVEEFRDQQVCIPLSGTSSFTTQMQIFNGFSLTALGIYTSATLGTTQGLTGYTVGYSGSNAALFTNSSVNVHTNSSNYNPSTLGSIASAAAGTTRTITITATGGTFDGTGSIFITLRQQQQVMAF